MQDSFTYRWRQASPILRLSSFVLPFYQRRERPRIKANDNSAEGLTWRA